MRKYCKETVILREIHQYQRIINLLISKLLFQHVIREVCHKLIEVNLRFQSKAIETLQKMTEVLKISIEQVI